MSERNASSKRVEAAIRDLAGFSVPGNGVTRLSYTPEHAQARDYLVSLMQASGLEVREDAIGNIIGRREGSVLGLPAIATGSHFDSVRDGGMFDGVAGVVCALEAARLFAESGYENRHPFEYIAIVEEEGARFGSGMLGGRALAGLLSDTDLDHLKDEDGVSVREAAVGFGLLPERLAADARGRENLAAFVELHIEQGPVLEQEELEIGVVTSIVGIKALRVIVEGRSDHAGTTPMQMRVDALVPAARMVQVVNREVLSLTDGTVATVGHFVVTPGGVNQVPGRVEFTVDIRSPHADSLSNITAEIMMMIEEEARNSSVAVTIEQFFSSEPVGLAPRVVDAVREAARGQNLTYRDMHSGAGHDSLFIAQVTDVGMIFVPSRAGRSHVPEEWTEFGELVNGTDVLVQVMRSLDEQLDQ